MTGVLPHISLSRLLRDISELCSKPLTSSFRDSDVLIRFPTQRFEKELGLSERFERMEGLGGEAAAGCGGAACEHDDNDDMLEDDNGQSFHQMQHQPSSSSSSSNQFSHMPTMNMSTMNPHHPPPSPMAFTATPRPPSRSQASPQMIVLYLYVSVTPKAGPYAAQSHTFLVSVPSGYPFRPPSVRASSRIFHPNVSWADGSVAIRALGRDWRPVMSLESVVLALTLCLIEPNVNAVGRDDCGDEDGALRCEQSVVLNERACRLYVNDRVDFAREVWECYQPRGDPVGGAMQSGNDNDKKRSRSYDRQVGGAGNAPGGDHAEGVIDISCARKLGRLYIGRGGKEDDGRWIKRNRVGR